MNPIIRLGDSILTDLGWPRNESAPLLLRAGRMLVRAAVLIVAAIFLTFAAIGGFTR